METYSYAESSESSRDVDFENHHQQQQPWEDHKVKFMCSYGGKIHPRPHDNHLSYVGGETKILAVDRFVKYADVMAKLTALCVVDGADVVCFKYQLPGEDLDALISVTNDDDLQHMMHEYDRLNRASPAARLRLFLFPVSGQSPSLTPVHSFGSTDRSDHREQQRFTDGLNFQSTTTTVPPSAHAGNTFELDKGILPPSGLISRTQNHQIGDPQDVIQTAGNIEADQIQKRTQELRIAEEQQPALYRKPSDDNLAAARYQLGDYYVPRMTEKVAPATGYQISTEQQQPVYMIHHQTPTSSTMTYMPSPVLSTPLNQQSQGYYVQNMMPTEVVYRDQQPVNYNVMPPAATQPVTHVAVAVATQQTTSSQQQQFQQQSTYTTDQGYRMVQSSNGGGTVTDHAQTVQAYDNTAFPGRQFYYANHGAVVAQQPLQTTAQHYQVTTAAATATLNQENAGN